jgi:signal transduction histidine kinase
MKGPFARRFSVRTEVALLVTLALVAGFLVVGGVWAPPPLESSGILEHLATMARGIEAAAPDQRAAIAGAVSRDELMVSWHDANARLAVQLAETTGLRDGSALIGEYFPAGVRRIEMFDSRRAIARSPDLHADFVRHPHIHFMAVNLADGSWVVFASTARHFWLSRGTRLALWLAYVAVAVLAVQALAAWQLARPIEKLSEAVRRFGVNSPAPPIAESGPKEMREVIGAFNAMRAQIQKFLSYRVAMLAAISHDLRTPLTRMRLRGEFIEDEEQQAKLFHDVDEMQAMVDGALAFFRDDAEEEDATQLDLPGVLKTIVNDYADQGIEIAYDGPAHAACCGRPFALKRAFTNLIENAVKYATPPSIILRQDENGITVTIRDGGPGIAEESLQLVFNPYFRLEQSRNRNSGGVGLGLTAAQSIIRGHGGDIVLRNRPQGGLDAEVTLPAQGE